MPRKKGFHPTPRDLRIAEELGQVLLMTVPLIERHFPKDTTGDSCLRRLRQMTQAHLIAPVAPHLTPSPRDCIYRLSEQGGGWLAYHTGHPPHRLLHAEPKPITLPHRLLVARVILALNDAACVAGVPPPHWILESDRIPEASCALSMPRQYQLAEDFLPLSPVADRPCEHYGAPKYGDDAPALLKVRPDAACLLQLPSQQSPRALYVEADNGTETQTQLLRKFPAYHALLTTHAYRRHWPDYLALPLQARVLFIFTSSERRDHIIDRLRAAPAAVWWCPAKYRSTDADLGQARSFLDEHFRFAVLDDLVRPDMLALPVWRTLTGQQKAIYPQRVST